MGEIADMMLDGTLCEGCGVYLDDSGDGFPRRCSSCEPFDSQPALAKPGKVECPTCKRHVKAAGLADHQRDKHGVGKEAGKQL